MAILIDKSGLLTTVQDLGRPALRSAGLPAGGAADPIALRTANLLVGNPQDAPALECALVGPDLRFTAPVDLAVTGAGVTGVPGRRRLRVGPGDRLSLDRLTDGAYAYVAVAGGLRVPAVLGGYGTDVRLGFGGFAGRALRAGDAIETGPAGVSRDLPTAHAAAVAPRDGTIRVVDGRDAGRVPADWLAADFTVSSKSDRAGVRLDGPAVGVTADATAASGVVLPGTVQLPGDGRPIVLLADAQTLGGYPQIAHVVRADLPALAQRRPGSTVRFERVGLAEAHRLARRLERDMALLRYGISLTPERHADH